MTNTALAWRMWILENQTDKEFKFTIASVAINMKMGVLKSLVLVGHDKVLAARRPLDCSPAHTAASAVELATNIREVSQEGPYVSREKAPTTGCKACFSIVS